jgi:hypothetical protein
MLKFFLIISFKPRNIVKENSEYLMNIKFFEMNFEILIHYSMNMCWILRSHHVKHFISNAEKGKITCGGRHLWPGFSLCCFLCRSPTLAYPYMAKQTSSTSSLWTLAFFFPKEKPLYNSHYNFYFNIFLLS